MEKARVVRVAVAVLLAAGAVGSAGLPAAAEQAAPLSALAQMPIKEITVFKDGHAFVLHEGKMPTDASGSVLMDYLPTPVMGAFWPYSANKNVDLKAVVAGQRKVLVERTALALRELIEANVGAAVVVTEAPAGKESQPLSYPATIVAVPVRSGEELEATSPPNSGDKLPQKGSIVILETGEGRKVVAIDRIQDVTFKRDHKTAAAGEEFRNLLTLRLDWRGKKPEKTADVGMMYLQRGIRWIPNYKITIDGKGEAVVKLQATLINELADLEDVTAQLVIGVPTFAFKDMVDPMALQQTLAQLSQYFREDTSSRQFLSNTLMSQSRGARGEPSDGRGAAPPVDLGPEMAGSERSEDLFVFTVRHVTLKKGQRMVLPVTEVKLKYKDVFTLDIPFTPPPEVRANLNTSQLRELAAMVRAPRVVHKLRLSNKSDYPLTTAPALIIRGDRVLAQGVMTYTSMGADADLPITTAVDINVKKTDKEASRTPNAVKWQDYQYGRIDLQGTIKLTNYRDGPADLEVTRHVLGNVTEASKGGEIEMVNIFEDDSFTRDGGPGYPYPSWWSWYSWPYWWHHFNGVGRIKWTLTLEATKSVELTYAWHYYWR